MGVSSRQVTAAGLVLVATIAGFYSLYVLRLKPEPEPEWRLVKEINTESLSWTRGYDEDWNIYWYTCTTEKFTTAVKWRFLIKAEDLMVEAYEKHPEDFPPVEHQRLAVRLVWIDESESWTAWEHSQKTNWDRIVSIDRTGEFCFIIVSFATFDPQVTITIEEFR